MNVVTQLGIPVLFIVLLSFVLSRLQWLNQAGFGKRFIVFFFIAKCLAGFAYNYVALHYIPNRGDIWPYFEDGRQMYQIFLTSPQAFFQTFSNSFSYTDLDATNTNSDFTRSAFELIKLFHFLLNFLSFGNLSGNTVIFNFLAVLCFFYTWKFLKQHLGNQGTIAGLLLFLLPSMFFYSSGIFKEGFVIALLCLLIPLSYKLITKHISFKAVVSWLLCFAALFLLKFFVAGVWLFCLVVWWLLLNFPKQQWLVVGACTLFLIVVFFHSHNISPALNFPQYLVKRQQEYLKLPAASAIPVAPLSTKAISFLKALPVAFNNVFFKPLPGEGGKKMYLIFSIEIFSFWLGMVYMVFHKRRETLVKGQQSLAFVFFLFALLNLLFIGLIVPNIGAIMRYRSIFMPFLALFFLIMSKWPTENASAYRKLSTFISR